MDIPDGDLTYKNNCIDGKCSNCGECCTDLLPLSAEEVRRLKAYARKHGLKEHTQAPFFAAGATDLTCPFRNQAEGKCDVYEVRPRICRSFVCTKTREQAKHDRDLLHQNDLPTLCGMRSSAIPKLALCWSDSPHLTKS